MLQSSATDVVHAQSNGHSLRPKLLARRVTDGFSLSTDELADR
jgi:hypothetical protein